MSCECSIPPLATSSRQAHAMLDGRADNRLVFHVLFPDDMDEWTSLLITCRQVLTSTRHADK